MLAVPLPASRDELPAGARHALTVGILAAHVAGGWALLQVPAVREAVGQVAPLMVEMIAPPAQPPTPPPPPQPKRAPPPKLIAAAPTPVPAPAAAIEVPPAPPAEVSAPAAPPAAPAPPAPAPTGPMKVSAGALVYTVKPPIEVPRMSRRLGESGTVQLRVVVDTQGLPRTVALHKSSGFARLDEQALGAFRAARFQPCTRDGAPIECEAIATLVYELEN